MRIWGIKEKTMQIYPNSIIDGPINKIKKLNMEKNISVQKYKILNSQLTESFKR